MFRTGQQHLLAAAVAVIAFWINQSWAQSPAHSPSTNEIRIVESQGDVEISPAGAMTWVLTRTNQVLRHFDRLRTGANSRVALRWSDQSVVPLGASTEIEILPPHRPDAQSGLHLVRGVISFFHRDQPGRIRVITRGAAAGIEGTEFVLAAATVDGVERTTLSVIDGKVEFGNEQASLLVTNRQQAVVELGKAPVRTAGFTANNVLQWCFYYPAILDPDELPLSPDEQEILRGSLEAYRTGDLLAALARYPAGRQPASDAERVYYGALLLAVGEVEKAESSLSAIIGQERPRQLAEALRLLIGTVKGQPGRPIFHPQRVTEFLANSYYEQSLAVPAFSLDAALQQARQAGERAPGLGFAWARVAELEFSFGRTDRALEVLDRSLAMAPRNAQALALKGFLLAAQNRPREEINWWFDRALATDAALANAWLGRGLCRIRGGDVAGGREDLLVAAALEPQRAELRSYLGKANAAAGDRPRAMKELALAQTLDPNDPTAWLYAALLDQEDNQINAAIHSLEHSQDLNDNRSVYRSQLLLDQDQAVRSANLAGVYRDADMADVSVREAARAVNDDYANYSAHRFLADSYRQFGSHNSINLRYETAAETEYLLANLLAPASAGAISPAISQKEYSRLFDLNPQLGVVSTTEYLSRGAWTEAGAQYGTFGNFSYELGGYYRSDPGQYANNDLDQRQLTLTFKQQFTPQDMVYLQAANYKSENGDLAQYYDPDQANPGLRVKESQQPLLGLGYHHEWSPGVHTLFLAARLADTLSLTNATAPTLIAVRPDVGLVSLQELTMRGTYESELEVYSAELQQIWQQPTHYTTLGARLQYGEFDVVTHLSDPSDLPGYFPGSSEPPIQQEVGPLFRRISVYGYHQWQIAEPLQLVGGLTYDWLTLPENFQTLPVSGATKTMDQFSPKAGFIWTPTADTTVRFAYTRSLGGASLDQSYRLEPSQVAGILQSYRSLIPESVAGPTAGARFETFGLSLEEKFSSGTYLGVSGDLLHSENERVVGTFDALPDDPDFVYATPSGLRQNLDFREQSLLFTANQLVGQEWSFGARYRLSRAVLNEDYVDVPDTLPVSDPDTPPARQRLEGILQQVALSATFNHRSGAFAKAEGLWFGQSNQDALAFEPGDNFWQFNALAGWRFLRRRAEASIGVLNITDQDYRLDPINRHPELPRDRTLIVRFQLSF